MPLPENFVVNILTAENVATRFEELCIDLLSHEEKVQYFTTSTSWDLGRDGKGLRDNRYIASTLRDDVQTKAVGDFQRLSQFSDVDHFVFCTTSLVSELEATRTEEAIREVAENKSTTINVFGLKQIAQLALKYPSAFERLYRGELINLRSYLLENYEEDAKATELGMRLALTTQLNDDGQALRSSILSNLILFSLADNRTHSMEDIVRRVSKSLQTGAVHNSYIMPEFEKLLVSQDISPIGNAYSLTETGKQRISQQTQDGSKKLLEGRQLFFNELNKLSGAELKINEFDVAWKIIQSELASLFFNNGMHVIEAVSSISQGHTEINQHADLTNRITKIGRKIEELQLRSPDMSKVLGTAFIDALSNKDSKLFEWLINMSYIYVAACSLGLSPDAQNQVKQRLSEIDLFLDTDVLLSFFGEAEPNHNAINDLIKSWKKLGGNVYVSDSVVKEVIYHGQSAKREWEDNWPKILKYDDDTASELLSTTFIRGFRKVAGARMSPKNWNQYINNYLTPSGDYSRINTLLKDNGILRIDESEINSNLANSLSQQLYQIKSQHEQDPNKLLYLNDKCSRDGKILALLQLHRSKNAPNGKSGTIVSSSGYLELVSERVDTTQDGVKIVMNAGAVAFMLSFIPGASLSTHSLQKLLFDPGFGEYVDRLEKSVLRILHASSEYSLPFSKRHILRNKMKESITVIAQRHGQSYETFAPEFISDNNTEYLQLISQNVDGLTTSLASKKITELMKENELKQRRIEYLERKSRRK